jgi:hypothetical protein
MRQVRRVMVGVVLLSVGLVMLGAKDGADSRAQREAQNWSPEMGPVVGSDLVYSEEYGDEVWEVEGTRHRVVMDESYDLLEVHFLE